VSARGDTEPLPVRERYSEAEQAVTAEWMDRHGDDVQNWPEEIVLAYANTIANMRAGGQL
jgi:hypothetical protein